MEEKKEIRRLCLSCMEEEAFQCYKGKFSRCFSCARKHRDRTHEEFVHKLSPEQLSLFEKYKEADNNFTSMIILD